MIPTLRLLFRASTASALSAAPSNGHQRLKTIGFIGLGAMGREMASNLLTKVFQQNKDPDLAFVIHDTFDQSVTRFLTSNSSLFPGRSILPCNSPAGVARLASTVVTMLPSSPEVEQVYLGEGGILEGLSDLGDPSIDKNRTLLIDSTTLDPSVAVKTANKIKQAGGGEEKGYWDMIDAPVSGGVVGANAGTLSFMVGSNSVGSFDKASEEFLVHMGSRAIHCGKNGNGLVAKIANNLLLGISMLGVTEAMLLGTANGLPAEVLAGIINTSTGKCWASEVNNPAPGALSKQPGSKISPPADRDYEGGFASRLMSKDLSLAMNAARLQGVPTPLGQLTATIYEALGKNEEFKDKDFGVAFKALSAALGREEFKQGSD
ncbi:hypothetical protein IE53DRAFT_389172 [Violaceomyces palustris]|uniref:Uncharacterized protein n=1 Tax=Violaceomyces palustris TaxID=1673888 RepID=A0ACD0NS34_9BASI|nr:hypothetical protein IE53DRAFT_389172 [Violaceomyces palustris]